MSAMRSIFRLRSIERFLNNIFASILLIAMMLLVVCDVTGRYLFNRPLHGTMEITEFIMVAVVYFTLAHTQAIKAHIRVELLSERMPLRIRLLLELITYLVGMVIFVLITWQGVMSAIDAGEVWEITDGLIPFPTLPAKITIPMGSSLLCLRFLADIIDTAKGLTRKDAQ